MTRYSWQRASRYESRRANNQSTRLAAFGEAAIAAGQAALGHAHLVGAAIGAGRARGGGGVDALCDGVFAQPHALPCEETNPDHVLFDYPAYGRKDQPERKSAPRCGCFWQSTTTSDSRPSLLIEKISGNGEFGLGVGGRSHGVRIDC